MGQLYVLAEIKGEIRLLALDAATGDLLWSQQLAVTEQSLFQCDAGRAGRLPTPTACSFARRPPAPSWA